MHYPYHQILTRRQYPTTHNHMATIDDFSRIEMRLGRICTVERVPDTDKLLRLTVDFGESEPRQVVSGIALYLADPHVLVGRVCPFVTNLDPRTIRGLESQAMIVAVHSDQGAFSILEPTMASLEPGTKLG